MTLKVFKYPVPLDDEVTIDLPHRAEVLDVQVQLGELYMWVLVDPEEEARPRTFRLAGTGHPIDYPWSELRHVSTFQLYGGGAVFHIFEIVGFLEAR